MRKSTRSLLEEAAAQREEIDAVLAKAEIAGKLAPLATGTAAQMCAPPAGGDTGRDLLDIRVTRKPGESIDAALARSRTAPFAQGAVTLSDWSNKGGIGGPVASVNEISRQLEQLANNASGGDLAHAEAMLAVQATTLDSMFNALARNAAACVDGHADGAERFLRMALKSQAQCRAAIESLAAIKLGPVVFARQANINNGGQQQVNNGGAAGATAPAPRTRARGKKERSGSNELLNGASGKRVAT